MHTVSFDSNFKQILKFSGLFEIRKSVDADLKLSILLGTLN